MVQINGFKGDTKHTKIEPDEFAGKTLGGKFGNTLIRFTKKVIEATSDWFEERLINFSVGVLVKIEQSGKTIVGPIIKKLKAEKAIPDFLKPVFDEIENPKHEIGALLAQSAGGSAIGGLFGAIFDPLLASTKYTLQKGITPYYPEMQHAILGKLFGVLSQAEEREILGYQGFDSKYHAMFEKIFKNQIPFAEVISLYLRGELREDQIPEKLGLLGFDEFDIELLKKLIYKIPSMAESVIAYFRGEITETDLTDIAKKNGVDDNFLKILVSANRRIIEIGDIRSIYYRAGKTDTWLTETLSKVGYSPEAIKDLKEIIPYFPAVPDLIKFAVREVYSPEIRSEYGLDEDFPPEFAEQAKKQGVEIEQAKNFWASHWILPSLLMGYEMLHRDVINVDQLKTLMRTQDIMPYWREKLIEISYNPLTRVDVRRMYNTGTLDEAGILKAYKDVGYNDENAGLMTEFTKNYYQSGEKNLTKSDILDGYKRKYLTEAEAIDLLVALGFDSETAEFYLSKISYKEEQEDKKEALSIAKDMFQKGVIDENEAISMLTNVGIEMSEINYHLKKWSIAKVSKPAKPSKDDLKKWLKAGIVPRETFIDEMTSLGFANKYIDYYLRELKQRGI